MVNQEFIFLFQLFKNVYILGQGSFINHITLLVKVTDVDEYSPEFVPSGPVVKSVPENISLYDLIYQLNATDRDSGDGVKVYSISYGNTKKMFSLDSTSGKLILQEPLDYEREKFYNLALEVRDSGNLTSTLILTILVTDVDDNDPECTDVFFTISVKEEVNMGTLYTPHCFDLDIVASPVLEYIPVNAPDEIKINKTTGEVTQIKYFDYENATTHGFTIVVKELNVVNPRSIKIMLTVNVEPVNEYDPVFQPLNNNGTYYVAENTKLGTSITQVLASDRDQGLQQGSVRYYIDGGNNDHVFDIDETSGNITIIGNVDRETLARYHLTVRASDDVPGSSAQRNATVTLDILITDVNDHTPQLIPLMYHAEVLETIKPVVTLLNFTVQDEDEGNNALVYINITDGNFENKFNIVGKTLVLKDYLDFETTTLYDLQLEIKDSGVPSLKSAGRVIITVLPVNEQAPHMNTSHDTIFLLENIPIGTLVYDANATDSDAGVDGEIVYSLATNSTNVFILDPTNGQLFVGAPMDFDHLPNTYSLIIVATDRFGASDITTSTISLSIILQDINDNYPVFAASVLNLTVNENEKLGVSVGRVLVTDDDSGSFGFLMYNVTGGNGLEFFNLNNVTGALVTRSNIDYETYKVLYLAVAAYDAGKPSLTSNCLVKIQVVNKNDNDPVITPPDMAVTIPETISPGDTVLTYIGFDKDTEISRFELVEYSDYFAIDPGTGELRTTAVMDRENFKELVLHIRVIDHGTDTDPLIRTSTATLTILIDDQNDNSPVVSGTYNKAVPENININEVVFKINASDADEGPGVFMGFSIIEGNTGQDFHVNSEGYVQVSNPLDRESVSQYKLHIRVTDHGVPQRSTDLYAIINVTDINDNNPVFTPAYYTFNISENSLVNTFVGAVNATDADEGLNSELSYSFDSFYVGKSSHFVVDKISGAIRVASADLDRESQAFYKAKLKVNDAGVPISRSSFAEVVIYINDLNDVVPAFTKSNYSVLIDEKTAVNKTVLIVQAVDRDFGINAEIGYFMDSNLYDGSLAKSYFNVDSETGSVSIINLISYENCQRFTFVVYAIDRGTPPLTGSTTVLIDIRDINDNNPIFSPSFYNTEVAYNGQCEKVVATVTAVDADFGQNSAISYYTQEEMFLFFITPETGALNQRGVAPKSARFTIEVHAKDGGTPVRRAEVPATVRVDTFDPNLYVVTFRLGISRTSFFAHVDSFLSHLQSVIQAHYPTAVVRLWCVEEYEGVAHPPVSGVRRLLADQPIDVHLYALRDNTTDSEANINTEKDFLQQDEFLSLVSANPQGDPGSSVQGSDWDYFDIIRVDPYYYKPIGWFDTTAGRVITAVVIFLGLILIGFLSYFLFRVCSKFWR
ncbi:cadherin EGF LAG seven-pass G-type receptor 2-like [Physella acuta]|uniref:cadherin EGF LAG seven-pass G-type receptor 2-like n=1 Tax=Physella acuta TaxID=109671 RepID=UPI0027DC88D5|nr:cadherin EGF LAG seven-pass G-type receptor 2-like [Physella acuta]